MTRYEVFYMKCPVKCDRCEKYPSDVKVNKTNTLNYTGASTYYCENCFETPRDNDCLSPKQAIEWHEKHHEVTDEVTNNWKKNYENALKEYYEDKVNNPSHYNQGEIECIDAIKVAVSGLDGFEAVCTANAIKYLWRWKQKNGVEDLNKAIWYINRLIKENE